MGVARRRDPNLDRWLSEATVDDLRSKIDRERTERVTSQMIIDECEEELTARQKAEWDRANGGGINI